MKKSEALDKIFNLIRTSKLKTIDDDFTCANEILNLIEDLGMSPPRVYNPDKRGGTPIFIREWEKEDIVAIMVPKEATLEFSNYLLNRPKGSGWLTREEKNAWIKEWEKRNEKK